jgi:hydroxymethylpyrimidine/phosphomethylpyrimidine kinase
VKTPLCILTIAGSDSGAGAGVQADARTIHALGGYALTAITAVTAQNTQGIVAWQPVGPDLIVAQIAATLGDFKVGAIKTGLLPGAAAVRAVAKELARQKRLPPLVVDPVVASSSGEQFLPLAGVRALRRDLLPLACLVTPNWPEVEILTGWPVRTDAEAEAAGRRLLETGVGAVLVKGGHGGGDTCRDCLIIAGSEPLWFSHPRIATQNTHGTGCVLSAAIATGLGRGLKLPAAFAQAQRLLTASLHEHRRQVWGEGRGPAFPGDLK